MIWSSTLPIGVDRARGFGFRLFQSANVTDECGHGSLRRVWPGHAKDLHGVLQSRVFSARHVSVSEHGARDVGRNSRPIEGGLLP